MTISKDLFLAILSMDSYNRGYDPGIDGLGGEGSKIGTATVQKDAQQLLSGSVAQNSGFYGVSYTISGSVNIPELNGETVISYRGTDDITGANNASDAWTGWLLGAGVTDWPWSGCSQAGLFGMAA